MKILVPAKVTVSVLNGTGWDTDLLVPAGKKIEVTNDTCVGTALTGVIMAKGGVP